MCRGYVCVCGGGIETLPEDLECQASPCICPPLWETMVPASGEGPDHLPCLGQYQTSRGNSATTTCQSPTATPPPQRGLVARPK